MVGAKGLKKMWCRGHLQIYHLPTKFRKIHQLVQKLLDEQADRRTDRLVILQACFHI